MKPIEYSRTVIIVALMSELSILFPFGNNILRNYLHRGGFPEVQSLPEVEPIKEEYHTRILQEYVDAAPKGGRMAGSLNKQVETFVQHFFRKRRHELQAHHEEFSADC